MRFLFCSCIFTMGEFYGIITAVHTHFGRNNDSSWRFWKRNTWFFLSFDIVLCASEFAYANKNIESHLVRASLSIPRENLMNCGIFSVARENKHIKTTSKAEQIRAERSKALNKNKMTIGIYFLSVLPNLIMALHKYWITYDIQSLCNSVLLT